MKPAMSMDHANKVAEIIRASDWHLNVLRAVQSRSLPDWAVAAGFIRNAVWDHLHDIPTSHVLSDVDVVYFDPIDVSAERDTCEETQLECLMRGPIWSVRNQARMHTRNGDRPYGSTFEAIGHWLETPTCVGVRLGTDGSIDVIAPHGLNDLFDLKVRPTGAGAKKLDQVRQRVIEKRWRETWPNLRLELEPGP